ncbi:hypothetical protein Vadar_029421 [Vaccinium darrowii]|uniref:Uncharacterized protein n=1 Tax=Vaccinium darrowii TaxID=229202 RepID=A0ACB7ZFM5_9ERIC|nr:hypothetical protein Vadar_012397 [Vaccinium darrowii]KAH7864420.1 hypothetical protein Vadar_029421 [Vaccinium darrowii]
MNFMQNKKERLRPKSSYDPYDIVGTSSEGYIGISRKNQAFGRYSAGSIDNIGVLGICVNIEVLSFETKDLSCLASTMDSGVKIEASYTPRLDVNGLVNSDHMGVTAGIRHDNDALPELDLDHSKLAPLFFLYLPDTFAMGVMKIQLLARVVHFSS